MPYENPEGVDANSTIRWSHRQSRTDDEETAQQTVKQMRLLQEVVFSPKTYLLHRQVAEAAASETGATSVGMWIVQSPVQRRYQTSRERSQLLVAGEGAAHTLGTANHFFELHSHLSLDPTGGV